MGGLERVALDAGSWVDLGRGWLPDHAEVYETLAGWDGWRQGQVWRYDHLRGENRLSGFVRPQSAPHPSLLRAHKALRSHYGVELTGLGLSWYRDGRDAMGAHRDSDLRWCSSTLVAVLTLGATRPWTLRPRNSGVRPVARSVDREAVDRAGLDRGTVDRMTVDLAPRAGDLLVMGGRAQADWLHGVPPVPGLRDGRISVQWRWTSRDGRPETGGGSRAPRHYGGGR